MNYYSTPPRSDEIWHHGIKGMRWGVRRWQNEDGSVTPAGERRYYRRDGSLKRRGARKLLQEYDKKNKRKYSRYDLEQKAYEYAGKHGVDYEAILGHRDYEGYLRNRNDTNSMKTKKKIVEYNKLLDAAEDEYQRLETDRRNKRNAYIEDLKRQMVRKKNR